MFHQILLYTKKKKNHQTLLEASSNPLTNSKHKLLCITLKNINEYYIDHNSHDLSLKKPKLVQDSSPLLEKEEQQQKDPS